MTPADLRIPLSALPGFDPVGLTIVSDRRSARVLDLDGHDLRVFDGRWMVHEPWWLSEGPPDIEWCLDLADASTRDRVARYIAARVDLEVGSTAPGWTNSDRSACRWILNGRDAAVFHGATPARGWKGRSRWRPHEVVVLALADLYPTDDIRLPDGSRLVDAVALARVAVHVGAR